MTEEPVRVLSDVQLVGEVVLDPAYTNPWEAAQAAKCTCFIGSPCRPGECGCQTPVMRCPVHHDSPIGRDELLIMERFYEGEP